MVGVHVWAYVCVRMHVCVCMCVRLAYKGKPLKDSRSVLWPRFKAKGDTCHVCWSRMTIIGSNTSTEILYLLCAPSRVHRFVHTAWRNGFRAGSAQPTSRISTRCPTPSPSVGLLRLSFASETRQLTASNHWLKTSLNPLNEVGCRAVRGQVHVELRCESKDIKV